MKYETMFKRRKLTEKAVSKLTDIISKCKTGIYDCSADKIELYEYTKQLNRGNYIFDKIQVLESNRCIKCPYYVKIKEWR